MKSESRLQDLLAISETVHRLTIGWSTVTEGHKVRHPGLLRQAREAVIYGDREEDDGDRKHVKPVVSRPPMPETIWLTIMEAEAQVGIIAHTYGAPIRNDPAATLGSLVGHCSNLDDRDLAGLLRELVHIRNRLEVALSWRESDRRLRGAACPECEDKALFVKLDVHGPISAYCAACHHTWDRGQLDDLAQHVNKEDAS